ncbi:MAG: YbaY family lipoprotein [Cyanobacteria bacterium P01_H01_bin.162]
MKKLWMLVTGLAIATILALLSLPSPPLVAEEMPSTDSPMASRAEVCGLVQSMPRAADTDELLTLLGSDRPSIIRDLEAMKTNMEQYDSEGYGWQNVIDGSSALEPRPASWLIGALGMACEESSTAMVTGTATYRQRIGLPPNATVVVTLADVSLADAPATVIAEQTIETAGQQVPIPFSLTYDPAEIKPQHSYGVRAQIFYGDSLRWTSTTAYPVITQGSPNEVEIEVEPV